MKKQEYKKDYVSFGKELKQNQLLTINGGGDDPESQGDTVAKAAGKFWLFTTAHFLTGGISTYLYLGKKINN